jgi:hypothetical protein
VTGRPSGAHPFGANPPSAENPDATQPFTAGSPGPADRPPFNPGSPGSTDRPPFRPSSLGSMGRPPINPGPARSTDGPPINPGSPRSTDRSPFGGGSPVSGGRPYGPGAQSSSPADAPHPYRDPYGVGGPGSASGPFGGFSAPSAQRTTTSGPYGSSVPQQRGDAPGFGGDGYPSPDATMPVPTGFPQADPTMPVYNYGSIDSTMPVSTNPVENSGSLTGHILAQGWHDEASDRRRSNVKVAIAMLVVLGLLVTVSLVFLFTAGDAFTNMVKGVFK